MTLNFRQKLLLFTFSLVLVTLLSMVAAVYGVSKFSIERDVEQELLSSADNFISAFEEVNQKFLATVSLSSKDFAVRKAIASGHKATIQSIVENFSFRLGADRVFFVNNTYQIVADSQSPLPQKKIFIYKDLLLQADQLAQVSDRLEIDDKLYQLYVVPVTAPARVGWLIAAVHIDAAYLKKFTVHSTIPMQLSFIGLANSREKIYASSLTLIEQRVLQQWLYAHTDSESIDYRNVHGHTYLTALVKIPSTYTDTPTKVLMQFDLDAALAPFHAIVFYMSIISMLILIGAVLASMALGKTLVKPISQLAHAASRVKQGSYKQLLQLQRSDELGHLADSLNDMMQGIAAREQQIMYQSLHDSSTNLPNRLKIEQDLDTSIKQGLYDKKNFAVVSLGIDNYDEIKFSLGHKIAERFTAILAQRLQEIKPSMCAVIAADIYILVLEYHDSADLQTQLQHVLLQLGDNCVLDDLSIDIDSYLGVALHPVHGKEATSLLQHADVALYVAKSQIQHYFIYEENKDPYNERRLSMMSDLKKGIKADELVLHYQPKISLKKQAITEVEVLVRWIHPQYGFMPPDEFIPLAEKTGNIYYVTEFVIQKAVQQAAQWQQLGYTLTVAINLSARDLHDKAIVEVLQNSCQQYQLAPHLVGLEITESSLMSDPEAAISTLKELHALGYKISIDDYGTGYSSLSYLKGLPIDELKIDKSFVLQLATSTDDRILVQSTIELGHNLGLTVVAEGVEDKDSMQLLQQYACDYGQGFYFSKPLKAEQLQLWLTESTWGIANES